jgi:hypothetical protein
VFYVGHVDKSSLYETLFHCNILSKHHHHYRWGQASSSVKGLFKHIVTVLHESVDEYTLHEQSITNNKEGLKDSGNPIPYSLTP